MSHFLWNRLTAILPEMLLQTSESFESQLFSGNMPANRFIDYYVKYIRYIFRARASSSGSTVGRDGGGDAETIISSDSDPRHAEVQYSPIHKLSQQVYM